MKTLSIAIVCFCLWCLLISAGEYCGNFPGQDFGDPGSYKIPENYRNYTYGFSLTVPKGFVGHGEQPPAPHHGFGILLSWEPRSYIYAGADYNSFDYESLEAIKDDHMKWSKGAAERVISVEEAPTILGSLPAVRFVVRHTCPNVKAIYVDDETIAWSKDREIIYQVYLLTTESRYEADKTVLHELLRTWKLSPIK